MPTLFNALINHPRVRAGRVDFSSIKVCFSGAAPLLAETRRRFEELTGGRIVAGYSLTEAMLACAVNPVEGPNKIGSVDMPLPDVEMRVVDPAGTRLPVGEVGEVLRRRALAANRRPRLPGRRRLPVHRRPRVKDLIKTHGYQVWPREIEEVLASHPAVAEVGVAGVPDEARGEVAKAWVVLRPGQQAGAEELRAFCRERLAPHKVPATVEFRAELPKSMVGKVLRRALTAEPEPAP